jgi:benzoyl-CoA reductase/2-hydroxyglutaryl-CoA dehydratase subunit BcrC/BadD/HgdB
MLFDLLQSRGPGVGDHDVARTRAFYESLAAMSGGRPSDDALRREIARANAARAAARRVTALRGRVARVTGAEAFPLLSSLWHLDPDDYVSMANAAAGEIAVRPALEGPHVLLSGAPVDAPVLHRAIESHGAIVVAEVGAWGSAAAGEDVRVDDDPLAALAEKYRADAISPRTPTDAIRRWTGRMLDEADAVVVSLPPDDAVFGWEYPALRERLRARAIPHVCLRGEPDQPLAASDHARLDDMVMAARLDKARHG